MSIKYQNIFKNYLCKKQEEEGVQTLHQGAYDLEAGIGNNLTFCHEVWRC